MGRWVGRVVERPNVSSAVRKERLFLQNEREKEREKERKKEIEASESVIT